jgi:hypothetical protein
MKKWILVALLVFFTTLTIAKAQSPISCAKSSNIDKKWIELQDQFRKGELIQNLAAEEGWYHMKCYSPFGPYRESKSIIGVIERTEADILRVHSLLIRVPDFEFSIPLTQKDEKRGQFILDKYRAQSFEASDEKYFWKSYTKKSWGDYDGVTHSQERQSKIFIAVRYSGCGPRNYYCEVIEKLK